MVQDRGKLSAMEMSMKIDFQKCMTRGGSPQGTSPNAKSVAFLAIFRAFSFSAPPYHPRSLPTLFPYLSPLSFHPAPPLPQGGEQET